MQHIGQKIKEMRKKNALTQEQLAEILGVTYQSVSKWETGVTCPDLTCIGPLTKALHISADELLGISAASYDAQREKYENAYLQYRGGDDCGASYWWAREAAAAYPGDYRYVEWLACTEYQPAFDESRKGTEHGSAAYVHELTDNALRRYEMILADSPDPETVRRAALGKILVLRFCERIAEAEWSAEFEYPDPFIHSVDEILPLCKAGRDLLQLLEDERAHASV